MKNEKEFLNFTHGRVLQSLCREIISFADDEKILFHIRIWIREEKRSLCKDQSSIWGPTGSQLTYYSYLQKIEEALETKPYEPTLAEIKKEIEQKTREEISFLFLTQEPACFPSVESLFHAAEKDQRYKASLVYTPFYHQNFSNQTNWLEEYQNMGLPVIPHDQYDMVQESPDLVLLIKPYKNVPNGYQYEELVKVIPRVVYVPYGMEITMDLIQFAFQYCLHYQAWRHVVYGPIVRQYAEKYGYRGGENVVAWGHPKADQFWDMEGKKDQIPDTWKKLIDGRKTILWTPHHLINPDQDGTGTWMIWGNKILDYAIQRKDLCFIIRPHPLLFGALEHDAGYSAKAVQKLRDRILAASNIILDETPSYREAFYASDAIITDGTTFSVEYLYTKKPILLTPRNLRGFYFYKEMMESYYIGDSFPKIQDFIEMVSRGEDPLKEKRLSLHDSVFTLPEKGTVAENILDNIAADLHRECDECDFVQDDLNQLETRKLNGEIMSVDYTDKKEMYPLVSIVIASYYNLEFLPGMLDTVFMQDYPRIQLIITDDGSDNFNVADVRNYIGIRQSNNIEDVMILKNEQNKGTVRNISGAVDRATGDYIIFTSADDRFVGEDTISSYVEAFLANPQSEWLVARCQMTSADFSQLVYVTPTEKDEPYFLANDAIRLYSRWSRRGMAIPCQMAFRKTAFEITGGFDFDFMYLEDWPLEMKLLRSNHAPIYLPRISAIHGMGGISNSNKRYGKELRKKFYDEKYLFFRKEVEPYRDLITEEDRKCYKKYRREIMARMYYFSIDLPDTSAKTKILQFLKKPVRFFWFLEKWYMDHKEAFYRKKILAAAGALLIVSLLMLHFDTAPVTDWLFKTLGYIELVAGLLLGAVGTLTYPLEKYYEHKKQIRKELVN